LGHCTNTNPTRKRGIDLSSLTRRVGMSAQYPSLKYALAEVAFLPIRFVGSDRRARLLGRRLMGAALPVWAVCAESIGLLPAAAVQLAHDGAERIYIVIVVVVIAAHIAGLLRAFLFLLIGTQHGRLNHFAARRVDGVGDVGVQLDAAIGVAHG